MTRNRQPIPPRNNRAPTQTAREQQRAARQISEALAVIRSELLQRFREIDYTIIVVNDSTYRYRLDEFVLDSLNDYIAELVDQMVMRADSGRPIVSASVEQAYQAATAAEIASMAAQTREFRRTLEETLMSPAYRTRIGLVRARVFEEMRGFTDQTRTDLARTLGDGMGRGLNPRDIATQIADRIGVAESRALRIARTEINNAHRRAILDEDEQVNEEGIRTRLLWFSALSPTTRPAHASRHGRIYTKQEVDDFFSRDGNAINCQCSVRSILVDESGNPLSDTLPDRLQLQGARFFQVAA